jgi:hypothetical protein
MSAQLHSVVVHPDTESARRLRRASNPDAGIVVAAVPPDMRRSYELTWELLVGMGKMPDVAGAGRREDLNWEVLAAWIGAHRIEHLVLVDTQWIGPKFLGDIVGLAAVTGVDLWLVAQQPLDDGYVVALSGWPVIEGPADELARLVAAALQMSETYVVPDFPAVPADNYPTFRAEARRVLSGSEFDQVDATYRAAFSAAAASFAQLVEGPGITEDRVLYEIRHQLHRCGTAEEMVVCVRGCQAAAHRAGWLVSAVLPRLVVTSEMASRAAVHAPSTWKRLRAYREPYRGAACALAALDLSIQTISGVRIADVSGSGQELEVPMAGELVHLEVPAGADLYLRAQVAHRLIQGAVPDELLFATEEGPMASKHLADAIRAPITEVGVPLYSQTLERVELDAKRWALRWGLSVQEL